jgi:hypothetical protein
MKNNVGISVLKIAVPIVISYFVSVAANQTWEHFGKEPFPILVVVSVCSVVSFVIDQVGTGSSAPAAKMDPLQWLFLISAIAIVAILAVFVLTLQR